MTWPVYATLFHIYTPKEQICGAPPRQEFPYPSIQGGTLTKCTMRRWICRGTDHLEQCSGHPMGNFIEVPRNSESSCNCKQPACPVPLCFWKQRW